MRDVASGGSNPATPGDPNPHYFEIGLSRAWREVREQPTGCTLYEAISAYDNRETDYLTLTARIREQVVQPWGHDGNGWTDMATPSSAPDSIDWLHESGMLTAQEKAELASLLLRPG